MDGGASALATAPPNLAPHKMHGAVPPGNNNGIPVENH